MFLVAAALVLTFIWGGNYGGKNKQQANQAIIVESLTTMTQAQSSTASETATQISAEQSTTELLSIEQSTTEQSTESTTDHPETTDSSEPLTQTSAPSVEDQSITMVINPDTGKDKYLTDPVPEGKPIPVEWQDVEIDTDTVYQCQLSVRCDTILQNLDIFNQDKLEVLPQDGVIYSLQTVDFYKGESVFNVLQREMKKNGIHMEFVMTPIYNSVYVEGINNLYEFDTGELSGWMYKVNGWFPNYGASRYQLRDGDVINWVYTCDLGRDVGGFSSVIVDELPEDKKKALDERIKKEQESNEE